MDGTPPPDLHARDFHAWTQDQAARLRALGARNDGLDVANLAEEIDGLGRSQRTALNSLTEQVLEHLLKLHFHPDQQPRRHWMKEVTAFRARLARELEDSPSLAAQLPELAAPEWRRAVRAFLRGLEADGHDPRAIGATLGNPDQPCFDLDAEVLDDAWFPAPPPG